MLTDESFIIGLGVVLSKDPVLRYQVGTKTSRYKFFFLSTSGTEDPVNPVLDPYGSYYFRDAENGIQS